eukprot:Skav228759  [mRNA]  locus=scaffold589:221250:228702:+ [translate_table: standard]
MCERRPDPRRVSRRPSLVQDLVEQAYGYAFILAAHAAARTAGVAQDNTGVARVFDMLEKKFWLPDKGAYLDTVSADGVVDNSYRGQNSNMHMCEALIAAFEATGELCYLDRAEVLAETFASKLASKGFGRVFHCVLELDRALIHDKKSKLSSVGCRTSLPQYQSVEIGWLVCPLFLSLSMDSFNPQAPPEGLAPLPGVQQERPFEHLQTLGLSTWASASWQNYPGQFATGTWLWKIPDFKGASEALQVLFSPCHRRSHAKYRCKGVEALRPFM